MADQTLVPAAQLAAKAKTPFPGESEAYRDARRALLEEEIEFRRHMTRLVEQRRALPDGPAVDKNYRFKDANGADIGLLDLFGDNDTLVSYFWMYGPQRERPCPGRGNREDRDERGDHIARVCAGDDDVRAQLSELLRSERAAEGVSQKPGKGWPGHFRRRSVARGAGAFATASPAISP